MTEINKKVKLLAKNVSYFSFTYYVQTSERLDEKKNAKFPAAPITLSSISNKIIVKLTTL